MKWKNLLDFNVLMPLLFLIFALTYFIDVSDKMYIGRALPQICCVLLMIFSARLLFVNVKKNLALDKAKEQIFDAKGRMLLLFVGLLFVYYYVILLIGYVFATLIFIPTAMLILGYKNKKVITITTIVFVAVVYVFFSVGFDLIMPQGSLIQGL